MNRKEFTRSFAEHFGITITTAKEVCKVFDYLALLLKEGKEKNIYIYNLGTFKHKIKKAKRVKHPITGAEIIIPERDEVAFSLSANISPTPEDEGEEKD